MGSCVIGFPDPTTPTLPPGPSGTAKMLPFLVVDMNPVCRKL